MKVGDKVVFKAPLSATMGCGTITAIYSAGSGMDSSLPGPRRERHCSKILVAYETRSEEWGCVGSALFNAQSFEKFCRVLPTEEESQTITKDQKDAQKNKTDSVHA